MLGHMGDRTPTKLPKAVDLGADDIGPVGKKNIATSEEPFRVFFKKTGETKLYISKLNVNQFRRGALT